MWHWQNQPPWGGVEWSESWPGVVEARYFRSAKAAVAAFVKAERESTLGTTYRLLRGRAVVAYVSRYELSGPFTWELR